MSAGVPAIVPRRPRKAVIAVAGEARTSDLGARAPAEALADLGVETRFLGREENARRIAAVVVDEQADAVELCLAGGCVQLLRELLRELIRLGRRDVSIVVHRVD